MYLFVMEFVREKANGKELVVKLGFMSPERRDSWLDFGLSAGSAVLMYYAGRLVGHGLDHVPYVKEWIPDAINYISGINVHGNIQGLMGVLSGIHGLEKSGIELNQKSLKPERYCLYPFYLKCREK